MSIKERISKLLFILSLISVAVQTVLTYTLLLGGIENQSLKTLTKSLFVWSVVLLGVMAIGAVVFNIYSRRVLKSYKRFTKAIKRILNLVIVLSSIMLVVVSGGSIFSLVSSIVILFINIILIIIDLKIAEISAKIERQKKKRRRIKSEKERQERIENNAETEPIKPHKKQWFVGDLSRVLGIFSVGKRKKKSKEVADDTDSFSVEED